MTRFVHFFLASATTALLMHQAIAATNPATQESTTPIPAAFCMVPLHDAGTLRFVNANYVRTIEIITKEQKDKRDNDVNPNVVVVKMASNYAARASYSIVYPDAKSALQAMELLVQKINNCSK